ncbi:MAG: TIGR03905 family TSCPD domain-containing protein [Muribaculaceae bacterium]|nr:TIGR03905 family TSCPD domain-containing protein [Muribaculaceae bacterium]
MKYQYQTQGTCSKLIEIETVIENGKEVIGDVRFTGGCNGNLQGIGALVKGLAPEEVIKRLDGLKCGAKATSCPDQLAKALREMTKP